MFFEKTELWSLYLLFPYHLCFSFSSSIIRLPYHFHLPGSLCHPPSFRREKRGPLPEIQTLFGVTSGGKGGAPSFKQKLGREKAASSCLVIRLPRYSGAPGRFSADTLSSDVSACRDVVLWSRPGNRNKVAETYAEGQTQPGLVRKKRVMEMILLLVWWRCVHLRSLQFKKKREKLISRHKTHNYLFHMITFNYIHSQCIMT